MDLLAGERVLWQGNPSWKALLLYYIRWIAVSLIPVVLWVIWDSVGSPPTVLLALLTLCGIVLTLVGGWVKRVTTRYRVTDRRINVRTGLLAKRDASTHLDRVQNVNVTQSIFQRILGIGNVEWDTAGSDTGDADFTFYGVDDPTRLMHVVDNALHAEAGARPAGL